MIKTLIIRNDIYNAKYLTSRHVKVSFERRRTFIIFLITVSQMMSFSSFYEKILIFLLVFFFYFRSSHSQRKIFHFVFTSTDTKTSLKLSNEISVNSAYFSVSLPPFAIQFNGRAVKTEVEKKNKVF